MSFLAVRLVPRAGMVALLVACGESAGGDARETDIESGSSGISEDTSTGESTSSGTHGPDTSDTRGGSDGTGGDHEPPEQVRGATLPYWEYEAEDAVTSGIILGPSRTFGEIAAESSGRRAVRLDRTGQYVAFTLEHPTNSIVVRYVIPDAPEGGGIAATLGLYVDGVRTVDLHLTSRYAWLYGGESNSANNTPGAGAHHFYDEVRVRFDDVRPGSIITLQKDAQDIAAYYVIDLVDFEQVGPPLEPPAGAIAITDHGATADDGTDDGPAIQAAIAAAKAAGSELWIPPGTFLSTSSRLVVSGVTIRGAGMWHSNLRGSHAMFEVSGSNNRFHDFALTAEVDRRDDSSPDNGFDGPAGTGSRLENVWIEHVKVGWWVGKGPLGGVPGEPLTDGLSVRGVRIRNTFADGINLCNGTSNSVIEQSHFRNTGDDALATWSPSFDGPPAANDTFRFNTVQLPWRASCFAIYGGRDHAIEDNVCLDTVVYPGVLVATTAAFDTHVFDGTTRVMRNSLVRAGGPMYGQEHGALKLFADATDITNVVVDDLLVEDATFSGIHFQGPQTFAGIELSGIDVAGAGTFGILVNGNAKGSANASHVVVTGTARGGLQNDASRTFSWVKGEGNRGW